MPGLPGDDDIEVPPGGVPVLELGDLDLEAPPAGVGGHPLVGLEAEDAAPALQEGSG